MFEESSNVIIHDQRLSYIVGFWNCPSFSTNVPVQICLKNLRVKNKKQVLKNPYFLLKIVCFLLISAGLIDSYVNKLWRLKTWLVKDGHNCGGKSKWTAISLCTTLRHDGGATSCWYGENTQVMVTTYSIHLAATYLYEWLDRGPYCKPSVFISHR